MPDRRTDSKHISEHRRRASDQREDFELRRDAILLGVGVIIVLVILVAAIFIRIKNTEVAIAVLTVGTGFLGAPTVLKLDERRGKK